MQQAGANKGQKLVIYTDDFVLGTGTKTLLEAESDLQVIAAESETSVLVPLVASVLPDLILIDTTPEMTIGLFAALRETVPEARLILWSRSFSDEIIEQCREIGVRNFLLRGCKKAEFIDGIRTVAAGGELTYQRQTPVRGTRVELTPRESQLISLLAQGIRNKEIANCLGITEGTVRIYLSKLFLKVGARDRFELALFGLKNSYCGSAFWDGQNGYVSDVDEDRARPVIRSLVLVEPKRRSGYPKAPQSIAV